MNCIGKRWLKELELAAEQEACSRTTPCISMCSVIVFIVCYSYSILGASTLSSIVPI